MSINNNEDWIIFNPYTLTEEDEGILQENPVTKADDWSKSIYKPIKDRIRDYYRNVQNGICCYCRLQINEATGYSNIEHIIDKNHRTDFEFEPRNLVLSCQKCNFFKSTKRVMEICPPHDEYPTDSQDFKIIHGHYDRYFDHIQILDSGVYQALDNVGSFTISACKLNRPELAEERVKEKQNAEDPIDMCVQRIKESKNPTEEMERLIEVLRGKINNLN